MTWTTDGKWNENRDCVPVCSSFGIVVAGAFYVGGTATAKINAHLIAAAPDMLDTLKAIAARGGNLSDEAHTHRSGSNDSVARGLMYVDCRTMALRAIRKAEGAA